MTSASAALDKITEHFDHTAPEHSKHLLERYRFLRSQCPITRSDQHGGFWVVSTYEAIVQALRDHQTFSSSDGIIIPGLANPVPMIPTESDEPLHAEYRGVLWPFLTPNAVADYEPWVRGIVADLIDGFVEDGRASFLEQFAKPLPARVLAGFFGFSTEEGLQCYEWLDAMFAPPAGRPEAAAKAAASFGGFLVQALARTEATPGDDVLSAIVRHQIDGRPLSSDERIGLLFTAIIGGLETTVSSLAFTALLIDEHPDVRQQLMADPSLLFNAVEEVLRIESPAQCPARTVRTETELGGTELQPGDRVLLLYGSGNHDESKFSAPDEFRLDRRANSHLAFGHGIHKCVGQHLARLELRVALDELLSRLPDFRVIDRPQPSMRAGSTWGVDEFDISFTPGAKSLHVS